MNKDKRSCLIAGTIIIAMMLQAYFKPDFLGWLIEQLTNF